MAGTSFGQDDAEMVESTVNRATIEGHIYFLASDELKGRQTGTNELEIAAEYIATSFRRYGVKPVPGAEEGFFQPIRLARTGFPETFRIAYGGTDISSENTILLSGKNIDGSLPLYYMEHGSDAEFEKAGDAVKGKVVVCKSGWENPDDGFYGPAAIKKNLAIAAGAAGVVEIFSQEPMPWDNVKRYFESNSVRVVDEKDTGVFLNAWIRDLDGNYMAAMKDARDPLSVEVGDRKVEMLPTKNVVGMVEGTDPELKDEFVIYSAHYDHVGIGKANAEGDSIFNGARDNAVGVVTVMSAAENIAKYPTKRSALFILFTGEEMGLIGSNYYASNPLIPLNQMVYCFNSDNGGYNDTSVATIIGLERTTAAKHIREACTTFGITAIDDPAPEQGLFDRSDNVSFARQGVPAPTFSLGFRAFDAEIMKYYHQASDNPDNLDYAYLEKFFKAYVMSCRLIANDPETPFWVEGDKYFEAGRKLYE